MIHLQLEGYRFPAYGQAADLLTPSMSGNLSGRARVKRVFGATPAVNHRMSPLSTIWQVKDICSVSDDLRDFQKPSRLSSARDNRDPSVVDHVYASSSILCASGTLNFPSFINTTVVWNLLGCQGRLLVIRVMFAN